MGVDLGGLDIGVTQQFLEDADVGAVFQHVGGEAVAQGVAADLFVDAGGLGGAFHRLLEPALQDVMAHDLPGAGVGGALPGREYPLPAGLLASVRVLAA